MSEIHHAQSPKRFVPLGQVCITTNALHTLDQLDAHAALQRHGRGDWGECGEEDWQSNEFALLHKDRLLSVYRDRNGTRFWIITEWDRSVTTILLPEDY